MPLECCHHYSSAVVAPHAVVPPRRRQIPTVVPFIPLPEQRRTLAFSSGWQVLSEHISVEIKAADPRFLCSVRFLELVDGE